MESTFSVRIEVFEYSGDRNFLQTSLLEVNDTSHVRAGSRKHSDSLTQYISLRHPMKLILIRKQTFVGEQGSGTLRAGSGQKLYPTRSATTAAPMIQGLLDDFFSWGGFRLSYVGNSGDSSFEVSMMMV